MNKSLKTIDTADSPAFKARVLIVDDSKSTLAILQHRLQNFPYAVHTAQSGAEALAVLDREDIDIMVTDIIMPEMNGLELMKEALPRKPSLECIVISGQDEIGTAVEAMKLGALNYLQKPVDISELDISIQKGMERVMLVREIEQKQKELEQYKNHLEQLVEERTAELEATNKQLKKDMAARKKAEKEAERRRQQLIEADKMASLGILVAGVAHEINNPNNFISMNTPILKRAWGDCVPIMEKYAEAHGDFTLAGIPFSEMRNHFPELFSGILDGSERIKKIVLNLRDYARQGISDMEQLFNVNDAVNAALVLLAGPLKKATNDLTVCCAEHLPEVKGNLQRAEQVIINVMQNAYQALGDPSQSLHISTRYDKKNKQVVVEVRDKGPGIPKKDLKRIQDPFFTTKRDAGGTGLGLSISAGIMEEHGGRLEFDSEPGEGTTVSIVFPVGHSSPHNQAPSPPQKH